jgi:hypothetical protein
MQLLISSNNTSIPTPTSTDHYLKGIQALFKFAGNAREEYEHGQSPCIFIIFLSP